MTGCNRKPSAAIILALGLASFIITGCRRQSPEHILLISIDTLRADHLGAYGYSRNTSPRIDALAKDCTVYDHAYPAGCWTMPSHMSLLTGTLPSRHGVNMDWGATYDGRYRVLNPHIPPVSALLRRQIPGMKTIKLARLPDKLGFDRGFDITEGIDPFHSEIEYRILMKNIAKHRKQRFFMFIHTWMVHAPYSSARFLLGGKASREDREYIYHLRDNRPQDANKRLRELIKQRRWFTSRHCMDLYDGGIYRVDQGVGRLMEDLKKMGLYKNMMIILVSDHGEHFGEHDPRRFYDAHGTEFYEEYIHVPLMIKYPRSLETGRVATPVSLMDVVPTLLRRMLLPVPEWVQGRILPGADIAGESVPIVSEAISIRNMERKMIRINKFKYILSMKNPRGPGRMNWEQVNRRRLFHLGNDPAELRNLFPYRAYKNVITEMEKRLARILLESVRLNQGGGKEQISEETRRQLKTLGYL